MSEKEGPYGEYLGYYGVVKQNPVFHVTAITHRKDAVFQTATISGGHMDMTDTSNLEALRTELNVWRALETVVREPVAVYAPVVGRRLDERALLAAPALCRRGAQRALHRARQRRRQERVRGRTTTSTFSTTSRWNGRSAPAIQPDRDLVVVTGVRSGAARSVAARRADRLAGRLRPDLAAGARLALGSRDAEAADLSRQAVPQSSRPRSKTDRNGSRN